jgi:hypothetical protein
VSWLYLNWLLQGEPTPWSQTYYGSTACGDGAARIVGASSRVRSLTDRSFEFRSILIRATASALPHLHLSPAKHPVRTAMYRIIVVE